MGYNRRLPIYLLIDTSESMAGPAFDAVQTGLSTMLGELRGNPMALETAALSVITFASTAQQVEPLTEIIKFQLPKLKMGSGTVLGAALKLWMDCMKRELVTTSPTQKGDYKPIVFIMTDGDPTDSWESAADTIKSTIAGKKANVIAAACGPDADVAKLNRITPTVLMLKGGPGDESGGFKEFFKWVSASVSTASQKLETAGDAGVGLPGLPGGVEVANTAQPAESPDPERLVFLHARCSRTKGFYIARYVKTGTQRAGMFSKRPVYAVAGAYRVDDFDHASTPSKLSVPIESLQGIAPCPYCNGPGMAICGQCNKLSCIRDENPVCGWCGFRGAIGNASGSVGRGQG